MHERFHPDTSCHMDLDDRNGFIDAGRSPYFADTARRKLRAACLDIVNGDDWGIYCPPVAQDDICANTSIQSILYCISRAKALLDAV